MHEAINIMYGYQNMQILLSFTMISLPSFKIKGLDLVCFHEIHFRILIWFNGTSAHMGHFSAKMVLCKMQRWLNLVD